MKQGTLKGFLAAYKKYNPTYDHYDRYIDEAISHLFKKYPGHKSIEQVFAKISLVNRVYRTNVERRKKEAEWKLAELLVANKFDNIIAPLKRIQKFNSETLPEIVKVHTRFVTLSKKTIRIRATSFCSKYLHFHFPKLIPIFDSNAYETAWRLVRKEICTSCGDIGDYEYFCLTILTLAEKLRSQGIRSANLKAIDYLLYDKLRK